MSYECQSWLTYWTITNLPVYLFNSFFQCVAVCFVDQIPNLEISIGKHVNRPVRNMICPKGKLHLEGIHFVPLFKSIVPPSLALTLWANSDSKKYPPGRQTLWATPHKRNVQPEVTCSPKKKKKSNLRLKCVLCGVRIVIVLVSEWVCAAWKCS